MPSGRRSSRWSPPPRTPIRWAVTGRELRTGDCFEVILVRLVTGCSWEDAERLCGTKVSDTTARSRRDEWVEAGVFEASPPKRSAPTTRSLAWTSPTSRSMGRCTKAQVAGKEPARTPPTGPSSAGSGRSSPTETEFPSAGPPTAPTATTRSSSPRPWTPPTPGACSKRSGRSGSTAATTSQATHTRLAERSIDDAVIAKRRKRGQGGEKTKAPHGTPMDGRADQLVTVELRAAPQKHRLQDHPPPRPARPRRRPAAHRQTHRLAKPLVIDPFTYPLRLLLTNLAPQPAFALVTASRPSPAPHQPLKLGCVGAADCTAEPSGARLHSGAERSPA